MNISSTVKPFVGSSAYGTKNTDLIYVIYVGKKVVGGGGGIWSMSSPPSFSLGSTCMQKGLLQVARFLQAGT